MGGGAIAAPPPIPGSSQMKMQFVPASHGQNTLGTDVPRIIRHDGAKNRAGRVPGTRTGAADLDYEGNVYTEKRVMWETLSPGMGGDSPHLTKNAHTLINYHEIT